MSYYYLIGAAVLLYYIYKVQPPLKPGEKSFTLYYWNKCGHCKAMMPAWNALPKTDITIRKVEASENKEYETNSYPTMVYRDGTGDEELYNGPRDLESLTSFLHSKL